MKIIAPIVISLIFLFTSCKTTEVVSGHSPEHTKVENLAKLKVGMDKSSVLSSLENVYPHEILNGTGNCEIHEYFYLKPQRSISNVSSLLKREELNNGDPKYAEKSKAYVVYRDNKLAVVYTNAASEEIASLLNVQNKIKAQCTNETSIPKGCMDVLSLTYDPDAIEDDGSCEYCDCGMAPNPEYSDKRPISECNSRCIDEGLIDANGNIIRNKKAEVEADEKCDQCDLIDALKDSESTVNLTISMGSKKAKKKAIKVAPNDFSLNPKALKSLKGVSEKKKKIKLKLKKEPKVVSSIKTIKVY